MPDEAQLDAIVNRLMSLSPDRLDAILAAMNAFCENKKRDTK